MNTDQKRCENCKKLFGRRVLADGRLEYPSNFKQRIFCSRKCSSTARQARKMLCEASA
jgi:hypothetical protein